MAGHQRPPRPARTRPARPAHRRPHRRHRMSPDLIAAAVLIGPGVLAAAALGTTAGVATLRQRPADRARARVLAELRAARATGPDDDPTPPDGGQPAPPEQPAPAPVGR